MKIPLRKTRDSRYLIIFLFFCSYCSSSAPETKNKTYTVEIRQMKFMPAELVVERGDTVVFINHDFLTHDVTEQSQKAWTSTPLPPHSSWTLVVTGTSDYYCTIHPVMKGRLLLQ